MTIGNMRDSWEGEDLTFLTHFNGVLWGIDCRFNVNAVDFGYKGTNTFKHY